MVSLLLVISQFASPVQACAMPRMEAVAEAPTKPSLADVFADIDDAAAPPVSDLQRALNQARSATPIIPEATVPAIKAPPKPAT